MDFTGKPPTSSPFPGPDGAPAERDLSALALPDAERGFAAGWANRRNLLTLAGLGALFLLWELGARLTHNIAVASPAEAFSALGRLLVSRSFHENFWISLWRILAGVGIGGTIGFVLGVGAGIRPELRWFLEPFRWTAMSIPPISLLVLVMLFFGLDTPMVIVFASILLSPIIYINTVKGMELVDRELEELARVCRFPLLMRVRHLYAPALTAPLLAGMAQVLSGGVRVVVLAELVGSGRGVGAAIHSANSNLNMPVLYAWIFLSVGIVAVFEWLLLRPLQNHLLRWNRP
jgi:NitT/TauT family transport system permease protein